MVKMAFDANKIWALVVVVSCLVFLFLIFRGGAPQLKPMYAGGPPYGGPYGSTTTQTSSTSSTSSTTSTTTTLPCDELCNVYPYGEDWDGVCASLSCPALNGVQATGKKGNCGGNDVCCCFLYCDCDEDDCPSDKPVGYYGFPDSDPCDGGWSVGCVATGGTYDPPGECCCAETTTSTSSTTSTLPCSDLCAAEGEEYSAGCTSGACPSLSGVEDTGMEGGCSGNDVCCCYEYCSCDEDDCPAGTVGYYGFPDSDPCDGNTDAGCIHSGGIYDPPGQCCCA